VTRSIRVLDPATVGQIAAGEVVDRPASVAKELVENAVDAGAARITVEIDSRGTEITLIRVTDDGCGMAADDAQRAFQRHATSKIRAIDDLESLSTLGFRGEALASIGAVARVELITRLHTSTEAVRIRVRGGKIDPPEPVGAPPGTSVAVTDLLYNTPARKKFLRSVHTETAHCIDVVERAALSHPGIACVCILNRNERFVTPGSGSLLDVIRAIHGREVADAMVRVRAEEGGVTVSGYVSRPSLTRSRSNALTISINHRPVTSTPLAGAVREGYGTLLPRGRHPVAFINLSLDPRRVDANVHPTKREVRLSEEAVVMEILARAVGSALRSRSEVRSIGTGVGHRAPSPSIDPQPPGVREAAHRPFLATDRQLRLTEGGDTGEEKEVLSDMEILGQFGNSYIVTRGTDGETLYLIDQHAAHERVLYEQVKERAGGRGRSQELIAPAVIHLSPAEQAAVTAALPLLEGEGFGLEPFGGRSWMVTAVPVVLGTMQGTEAIRDVISGFVSGEPDGYEGDREHLVRLLSCRGAIKAETPLSVEQMERLLSQLRRCRDPLTCPHGRPTVLAFPRSRVDGFFLRT